MPKLLHLSDLHINEHEPVGIYETRKAFRYIIDRYAVQGPRPWILITGDLVDSPTHANFDRAAELLGELREHFTLRLIPGNHDVLALGVIANPFAQANLAAEGLFHARLVGHKPTYPQQDELGGWTLLGLHSMTHRGFFGADGQLGQRQLGVLGRRIKRAREANRRVVVYLHHHPFRLDDSWDRASGLAPEVVEQLMFRLKDADALAQHLRDRVDLVLFGHHHNHADLSGTDPARALGVPHVLSCGRTSAVSKHYAALPTGARSARVLAEGLLFFEIDLGDTIQIKTVAVPS